MRASSIARECLNSTQAVRNRLVTRCPAAVGVCGVACSSPAVSAAMVARTARASVYASNVATALASPFSPPGLRLDRCNQRSRPHDVDDAREIVSEDVERHLGGRALKPKNQKVGCSHPRLERPERMLDRLTPLAHFFRVLVEPALDGFENMLMLPARNPSLLAGGTAVLDGAALTGVGPVATQDQPFFLVGVAVGESFTSRADVYVLVSHVAEVLLAKTPIGLGVRGHRLWQRDCNARLLAGQDLRAVEVAAVGDDIEALCLEYVFRLLGHAGELRPVVADIGHLVRDDLMMLGVDGHLHVVTHNARASAACGHRPGIGVSKRYLLVRRGQHLHIECLQPLHLLFQFCELLFEASGLRASEGSCRSALSSW